MTAVTRPCSTAPVTPFITTAWGAFFNTCHAHDTPLALRGQAVWRSWRGSTYQAQVLKVEVNGEVLDREPSIVIVVITH